MCSAGYLSSNQEAVTSADMMGTSLSEGKRIERKIEGNLVFKNHFMVETCLPLKIDQSRLKIKSRQE